MDNCKYCGNITHHDVNHFHGRVSQFCAKSDSPNCGQNWQNFKYRVEKAMKSQYPKVRELAYEINEKVILNGEFALNWNVQLISAIKREKKLAMAKVLQK